MQLMIVIGKDYSAKLDLKHLRILDEENDENPCRCLFHFLNMNDLKFTSLNFFPIIKNH